ncbi:hypothetical protein Tco_1300309, partial [Tanacetum coccineum]
MRELREDTFLGYKNDDAQEHVEKQEGDETLYHAWERRTSSGGSDGTAVITNKLDSLGRDMDKFKENVHAIQEETHEEEVVRETQEVEEANETMVVTTSHNLPIITHYVAPYEPPIPFPSRLAHHAKEALVSRKIESLREIRVNLPLIKEIRKTNDYARHMKNLVVNKTTTLEEGDVKPNFRCLAFLHNQLSPMEKDLGSFILPCSIGNLTVRNALVVLGANVSIMPLSMFKWLGLGKLKPVSMTVEMADRTKSMPKGIVENFLVKIDKFIFPIDFVILDMVEDFRMTIILGRPLLATTNAKIDVFRKLISLELGNEKVVFKIEYNFNETLTPIESVCTLRKLISLRISNEKGIQE